MKKSEHDFFLRVIRRDTKDAIAEMPEDETAVIFAECVAILCGNAAAKMLRESTPESRAEFVRKWREDGAAYAKRKQAERAARGEAETPPPPAKQHKGKADTAPAPVAKGKRAGAHTARPSRPASKTAKRRAKG